MIGWMKRDKDGQSMMKYSSVEIDSTADKTLIRFEMKLVEHVDHDAGTRR